MNRDLAQIAIRRTQQDRPTDRRSGILPERRDTRAPELQTFARMGTAARGDGGASELMRTLGVVSRAAESFQDYANRKYQHDEEVNAGQGAVDQASGHIDSELMEQSHAYKTAVELGREQTNFPEAVRAYGEELTGLIEHQTSSDLVERRREAEASIEQFFQSYAIDPETGDIKAGLTSPQTKRWLAAAVTENRSRLSAAAHARITERMGSEALTNVGTVAASQLDQGQLDVAELRRLLPSTVTDDQLRGTILTTVQGKAEQLKADGKYEDALRIVNQMLGEGLTPGTVQTIDLPASGAGGVLAATAAVTAAPRAPTVGKRRSRDEVIGFVLNTLEGGAQVVDNRDGGGTTKFGITKRHNPDVDVANLTFGQASAIARDRYWQGVYNDANAAVAAIAFDAGFINSKSFGRELATKYRNDPVGALNGYRQRLQEIARKPDKARFLRAWMNRVDRLGTYLGVGPGGQGSDNVIDDPAFALDPEPLDPVEAARQNPGISLAPQLTGGLALRPEERTKLLEYRDQLGREVRQEWQRKTAEKQDETHSGYLLRLSGLGAPLTPTEIAEAARRREITPQQTTNLLNVIRSDADRDEARAERAANEAERDRDKADEQQAQGIVASLMGPVYSGQRSPSEALRLFSKQAASLDPKVRRAVLGAVTSEANGIEEVRKNNPALRAATDALDDGEAELLRLVRGNYRGPDGRVLTAEQQRAVISLEFSKAKRSLFQSAIDKGDIGQLREELVRNIKQRVRPYVTNRAAQRR
ncbi:MULTISPECIES: glycosyl hydrolase 108 family protein [Sphingomonas]|uniref:glycosyl hydrolase 108 family protein n=1 Tax=Sphingomonas TaxID=13687 RepID=UPI00255106AC|nr:MULTISPECIES: glycosyl hydrolase 108 family protein [Sphingomonas]MDK8184272.1 glycosyl hydrolase 108 family protein [Sphingomonas zeae]MDK8214639.1 glycosyl hydrolase 108 family protein [Sphingomonas sp. UMB7805-LC452B]